MITARLTARLLKRWWTGLAALVAVLVLFEVLNPYVANSLGGPVGLDAIVQRLPPLLLALIRAQAGDIVASGLAGYLAVGFTHPLYLILTAIPLVAFACLTLAGEMARGTIQLALARPISRPRVYGARVLGLLVVALVLAAAGPLGMLLGLALARPVGRVVLGHFWAVGVVTLALFWAIGGLALLAAAATGSTGRAVGWAAGVLLVSYLVEYLARLWRAVKPLAPFSLYDHYDPAAALAAGTVRIGEVALLVAVGAIATLAGLVVFARRDLPA